MRVFGCVARGREVTGDARQLGRELGDERARIRLSRVGHVDATRVMVQ